MVKLNGWKRIGIIASVIWILGAGAYTYDSEIDRASLSISEVYLACNGAAKERFPSKAPDFIPDPSTVPIPPGAQIGDASDCKKEADDSLTLAINNARSDGVLVALVPVPLGWGITYLVLFLVRWVKRGFTHPFLGHVHTK
jgi:hypothetical protein